MPVAHFPGSQATETGTINATPVSGAPNSAPLNMFPQVNLMIVEGLSFNLTWLYVYLKLEYSRKHSQVLVLVHLDPSTSLGTIIR